MSFDVSMRLRLDYKDRDARRAEKDLKDIQAAAKRLNGTGTGKLEKDLEDVSRNARAAATALDLPAEKVTRLNGLKTDRVEAELNTLKAAAGHLSGKLDLPAQKIRKLNQLKTDKAERELKDLGRAANGAAGSLEKVDKTKFNRLNGEIDRTRTKLGTLDDRLNAHTAINGPAGRLTGVMGGLGTAAGNAFAGLLAFASVDNILRGLTQLEDGFNRLDDAAARVAVTAEVLAPEAVDTIRESNDTLALKYGRPTADVNAARDVFAAANFPIDQQNRLLDPTTKAANASGADPSIMANAVLSGMNSLGITDRDVPAFLDQIVKGGKEGEFEIEAMAKYFPELGALYAASGRTGLDASAELIALAQITRKGAGMESGAATNLQNFLSKMSGPDTVKNFKEKGVDLPKLAENAQASGTPYVLALLDEVERLTGGDEFKIGELFGDMQAKAALRPLLTKRDLYSEIYDAVRNQSGGGVDKDYDFLADRPKGKKDRRDAAWAQIGASLGETWGSTIGPIRDEFLGWLHPEWRRMEEGRADRKRLKSVEVEGLEADIADMRARLDDMGAPTNGMPDIHASGRTNLQLRLREMEAELQRAREVQGAATETPVPERPSNVPRAKPGRLPGKQSSLIPDIGDTAGHLQSAGSEAGAKFAAALEAETKRLGSVADNLESRFSFTATPTISPQFSAGSGSASPAAATRSSAGGAGPVVHQTFNGTSDPQRTARYATREQNRAIRRSRNRALHDLGSFA